MGIARSVSEPPSSWPETSWPAAFWVWSATWSWAPRSAPDRTSTPTLPPSASPTSSSSCLPALPWAAPLFPPSPPTWPRANLTTRGRSPARSSTWSSSPPSWRSPRRSSPPRLWCRGWSPASRPSTSSFTVDLTRLMLLSPVFFCASGIITGILNARHHFLLPAVAPLLYNAAIVIRAVTLAGPLGVFGRPGAW
ncbi:MAG: hypothetical protein EXR51_11980 [Dehalococcoidia bacterium]|nr:hypothetical protein [Dehalococcoidia bacterium]